VLRFALFALVRHMTAKRVAYNGSDFLYNSTFALELRILAIEAP
jgi:hypothetical protein